MSEIPDWSVYDKKMVEDNDVSFTKHITQKITPQIQDLMNSIKKKEAVNNPDHYGGANNPYEAIKVIEAWVLNFNLGNAVKYISRAGKKDDIVQDLKKARWYLDREIQNLEKEKKIGD